MKHPAAESAAQPRRRRERPPPACPPAPAGAGLHDDAHSRSPRYWPRRTSGWNSARPWDMLIHDPRTADRRPGARQPRAGRELMDAGGIRQLDGFIARILAHAWTRRSAPRAAGPGPACAPVQPAEPAPHLAGRPLRPRQRLLRGHARPLAGLPAATGPTPTTWPLRRPPSSTSSAASSASGPACACSTSAAAGQPDEVRRRALRRRMSGPDDLARAGSSGPGARRAAGQLPPGGSPVQSWRQRALRAHRLGGHVRARRRQEPSRLLGE